MIPCKAPPRPQLQNPLWPKLDLLEVFASQQPPFGLAVNTSGALLSLAAGSRHRPAGRCHRHSRVGTGLGCYSDRRGAPAMPVAVEAPAI